MIVNAGRHAGFVYGGAQPYVPLFASDLTLWLDAIKDGVPGGGNKQNNDPIGGANEPAIDWSGNGRDMDASSTGTPLFVTNAMNGHPAYDLSNAGKSFDFKTAVTDGITNGTPGYWGVGFNVRFNGAAPGDVGDRMIAGNVTGTGFACGWEGPAPTGTRLRLSYSGGGGYFLTGPTCAAMLDNAGHNVFIRHKTNQATLFVDGVQYDTIAFPNGAGYDFRYVGMGTFGGVPSRFGYTWTSEVRYYLKSFSDAEALAVAADMMARYGIT